jgi:hypothetical protein
MPGVTELDRRHDGTFFENREPHRRVGFISCGGEHEDTDRHCDCSETPIPLI